MPRQIQLRHYHASVCANSRMFIKPLCLAMRYRDLISKETCLAIAPGACRGDWPRQIPSAAFVRSTACLTRIPCMSRAALQRGAMRTISAAADFNAAPPSSSRRCRIGRSLWKVLTFVGPLLRRASSPAFFFSDPSPLVSAF